MTNEVVVAARELLRFRPGNTGPDGWEQFKGEDREWDAMEDAAWERLADALTALENVDAK
jgi:hypothetical protein